MDEQEQSQLREAAEKAETDGLDIWYLEGDLSRCPENQIKFPPRDRKFIAAASPDKVLWMLDEIKRLGNKNREDLREAILILKSISRVHFCQECNDKLSITLYPTWAKALEKK